MLTLSTNNYELDNIVPRAYKTIDSKLFLGSTRYAHGFVYSSPIGCALMPLLFNDIKYSTYTIVKSDTTITDTLIANKLDSTFESTNEQDLEYIRVFTSIDSFDSVCEHINKDIFTTVSDAVTSLYNKCLDQTLLREEIHGTHKIKVFKSRTKHILVSVTTYKDRDQESDFFLTAGLIPVLFEDYKSRFNEIEIEYFKTLVNRSQVKRISNVKATESFKAVVESEKYVKKMNKIRMEATVIQLVNNRISDAEQRSSEALRECETYLNGYHTAKESYYRAEEFLSKVRESRDSAIEEFNEALNMDNIILTTIQGNIIDIYIRAHADFFVQDEAELVINNRTTGWLKQFFTDVFIDQKYKLNILTRFRFDYRLNNNSFNKPGAINNSTLINHNAMFNPHIQFFSCLGDYLPQIMDAHAKKDLLLFNNLAIASTRSINFRDGTVMNRWIDYLANRHTDYDGDLWDIKCIEDEDHNLHSIRELYMSSEVEVHDAGEELPF